MSLESIDTHNLLETVEEYLHAQNWRFMRPSDEEIYVELKGAGTYRLFFLWDEQTASLQLCCELDVTIDANRACEVYSLMAEINNRLWLGHFDFTNDEGRLTPCFRYTGLYRGMPESAASQMVDDLIQLAVTECDRTRQAFVLMSGEAEDASPELVQLALAAPAGQG
jgi:hypothetical protein